MEIKAANDGGPEHTYIYRPYAKVVPKLHGTKALSYIVPIDIYQDKLPANSK
jgi:hypothetical protein